MSEIKCGNEGLDYADRQNMHSCSVAVKAFVKLEQKADQYREDKQFESLLGRILVYSNSHDQKDARLYGHYALVEGEKWTYYRHCIEKFDIARERDLLALHNFARNVLTVYAPKLLKRLQKTIAALPVSLHQGSQQTSQGRDAEGFVTPVLPASTQKLFDEQKEQINKLLRQMERQSEEMEQQRKENEEKEERQSEEMEQQRKENKEKEESQREEMERRMHKLKKEKNELKEQIKELMDLLWRGEKYMPKSRQVVKKLMESGRTLRNVLIGGLSLHLDQHLQAITYCFPLLCFARFPFLVLARPATDHSAHTPLLPLFTTQTNQELGSEYWVLIRSGK